MLKSKRIEKLEAENGWLKNKIYELTKNVNEKNAEIEMLKVKVNRLENINKIK